MHLFDPETIGENVRAGSFLSGITHFETGTENGVALSCRYDETVFSPSLFSTLRIARPDHLQEAIGKRQAEYLAGRSLVQSALSLLDHPAAEVPIGEGGAPQWPLGIRGSISHSKGVCVCLVLKNPSALVGIDVEKIASEQLMAAIMRMTINHRERYLLKVQSEFPRPLLASLIFSAKETLYKLLYPVTRRYFGFSSAELRFLPKAGRLSLYLTCDLHESLPKDMVFELNYKVSQHHVTTWAATLLPSENCTQQTKTQATTYSG